MLVPAVSYAPWRPSYPRRVQASTRRPSTGITSLSWPTSSSTSTTRGTITKEAIQHEAQKPEYPGHFIKYRYYGHFIEGMIQRVCAMEMGPERAAAEYFIALQMKRDYMTWNQGNVEDIKIFKDLFELSDGQILLTPENCKLNINPNTIDKPGKLQKPLNSKKAKKK